MKHLRFNKKISCFLLIAFMCLNVGAQKVSTDSLRKALLTAKEDTTKNREAIAVHRNRTAFYNA